MALSGDFRRYMRNSLIAAGGATALGILLAVPAAWGFAKFPFPGSAALLAFTVVTRVFPPIALALPYFLQFRAIGLIDTPLGLVIGYLPIVLPLMIWILTGFFRDFPDDLVDAARVDGLGTARHAGAHRASAVVAWPRRRRAVRLPRRLERVRHRPDHHPHARLADDARGHLDADHPVPDPLG